MDKEPTLPSNATEMAMPKFDALMWPFLNVLADGSEHRYNEVVSRIADDLQLSDQDRIEPMASGRLRFRNRVYWAKLYLNQAGAIKSIRAGVFVITDRGRDLLKLSHRRVTVDDLMEFAEFRAFKERSGSKAPRSNGSREPLDVDAGSSETPEDAIQSAYEKLKAAVVSEVLNEVRKAEPTRLASIMVQLLIAMGYGDEESGIVLDGVNGGIDGVVKKDKLGSSSVYIQAKRYKDGNTVGAPAIQQFAGSMQERRADEGVFVTTSDFTKAALESVSRLRARIALINGQRLAEIMFDLGVGVKVQAVLALKRVDSDFFADA